MEWTTQQIMYVLYNNRSIEGVVTNFLPSDIDPYKLIEIEKQLKWCKVPFDVEGGDIDINQFNLSSDDIIIKKDDIINLTDKVLEGVGKFNDNESKFLEKRGLTELVNKYQLSSLSNIKDKSDLIKLNATCHPLLTNILEDGIQNGGIIIPLFKEGKLINSAIRKISDVGKLKYTLTCPDVDIWGIENIKRGDEVWITEGIFDMMALESIGLKSVSVSSAMWTGIQLYKLIETSPSKINILCDNDSVGLRTGFILNKFFNLNYIESSTWIMKSGKDAAESILQLNSNDIIEHKIDINSIEIDNNESFLDYLKKRKF